MPPLKVFLVIPAKNEAENIGRVVEEALGLTLSADYSLQILVVDGQSTDGTGALARQAGAKVVEQRHGKGYGAACFTGLEEATLAGADLLVYMDGDYSDSPAAIPALLDKLLLKKASLVLGVREGALAEKGALPLHQVLGNRLVILLVNRLYGSRYPDLPSLKLIRREVLSSFQMQELTYGWTTEMLVKAARAGCRVEEVAVPFRRRGGGHSKVSGTFRGTFKAGYGLLKTAWQYRNWTPEYFFSPD